MTSKDRFEIKLWKTNEIEKELEMCVVRAILTARIIFKLKMQYIEFQNITINILFIICYLHITMIKRYPAFVRYQKY